MQKSALDELNIDLDFWTATTSDERLAAILAGLSVPNPSIALATMSSLIGDEVMVSILVSYFAGVYQIRQHNEGAACGLDGKRPVTERECDGDIESQASEEG